MLKTVSVLLCCLIIIISSLFIFKKEIRILIKDIYYQFFLKKDQVDELIISNLNDNIEITKPYKKSPRIQIKRISESIKHHPFKRYYIDLLEYLNSNEILLESKIISETFQKDCFENKELCKKKFLSLFGYQDLLYKQQNHIKLVSQKKQGNYILKRYNLYDGIGYYLPVLYLSRTDNLKNIKGTVIAIHGRTSSPDLLLGLEKNDYSRSLGKIWADAGYEVYAPLVQNGSGLDFRILGFSPQGYDLFQLNNLLNYISQSTSKDIILTGISYGAVLAEALTILDNDKKIHTTISIQSTFSNKDWMFQQLHSSNMKKAKLKGRGENNFHYYPDSFTSFFHGFLVYYLIHPDRLIISISSEIKNNEFFDSKVSNKFYKKIFNLYSESQNTKKFNFHYFIGGHEADPIMEIKIFEDSYIVK